MYSCSEVQMCHPSVKLLENGKKTPIGSFLVQPIPLYHNVECIGFLIEHEAMGRMVFCTDTNSIPYKFKNINHWVVEANYDDKLIIDQLCDNTYTVSASENHMSIDDTIEFLRHNYSPSIRSVTLIHLSNGHSNALNFQERVKTTLGFANIYIADSGLEINIDKEMF